MDQILIDTEVKRRVEEEGGEKIIKINGGSSGSDGGRRHTKLNKMVNSIMHHIFNIQGDRGIHVHF